jgi:hypothetical protein
MRTSRKTKPDRGIKRPDEAGKRSIVDQISNKTSDDCYNPPVPPAHHPVPIPIKNLEATVEKYLHAAARFTVVCFHFSRTKSGPCPH